MGVYYKKINKSSIWFSYYCVVDTEDNLARNLFSAEDVRVLWDNGYLLRGSPYSVHMCRCLKSDEGKFLKVIKKLPAHMDVMGYPYYLKYCSKFRDFMQEE